MYGDCEELLGKWFKRTGKRDQVFLATKFGIVPGSMSEIDSSGPYCKQACAKSLATLGTDYIDLYYVHRVNASTPIEETMRALLELKRPVYPSPPPQFSPPIPTKDQPTDSGPAARARSSTSASPR